MATIAELVDFSKLTVFEEIKKEPIEVGEVSTVKKNKTKNEIKESDNNKQNNNTVSNQSTKKKKKKNALVGFEKTRDTSIYTFSFTGSNRGISRRPKIVAHAPLTELNKPIDKNRRKNHGITALSIGSATEHYNKVCIYCGSEDTWMNRSICYDCQKRKESAIKMRKHSSSINSDSAGFGSNYDRMDTRDGWGYRTYGGSAYSYYPRYSY